MQSFYHCSSIQKIQNILLFFPFPYKSPLSKFFFNTQEPSMSYANQVYSRNAGISTVQPVISLSAAPSSSMTQYPLGTFAIVPTSNSVYQLTSFSSSNSVVTANWTLLASNGGDVVAVVGTTNEITATTSSGTVTLSIPSTFVAPGSIASTTTLTGGTGITATTGNIVATAGNITTTAGSITSATTLTATSGAITATNGNLVLATAGNKLLVKATSSATCSAGTGTLNGSGTVTISNSAVTASSLIFLTATSTSADSGVLSVGTIVAATSFVVNSSNASDANTFNFLIIN
jgi:trimeric autotransporter adhesin